MDVSKLVGGSGRAPAAAAAPRAPAAGRAAPRVAEKVAEADAVATSGGANGVAALTARARALPASRDEVVSAFRELLGRGLLDTPDAAARAARGLLGG